MPDPAMHGTSSYERAPHDAYDTRSWVTQLVLDRIHFDGPISEPAAGAWKLGEVAAAAGLVVHGSDIAPRAAGIDPIDFLKEEDRYLRAMAIAFGPLPRFHIWTNPPFGTKTNPLAEMFVRQAIRILNLQHDAYGHTGQMAWMLLRHEWDCAGDTRGDLFASRTGVVAPFCQIVINRRIQWFDGPPPGKDKASTGRHNYSWFGWMAGWTGPFFKLYGPHDGAST